MLVLIETRVEGVKSITTLTDHRTREEVGKIITSYKVTWVVQYSTRFIGLKPVQKLL